MEIDMNQFSKPCSCGMTHHVQVRNIYIEENATKYLPKILKNYESPVFICDKNTRKATEQALAPFFDLYPVIELTDDCIIADNNNVDTINNLLVNQPDLLVAVGSGTIHDLTRYVSNQLSIPFLSYPTAASVDGFLSTGAAMTWFGLKKTFQAQSPLYVIADTNIFANAPYRLTASGFADLLGKYTALADWKISDLVSSEPFCQEIHDLVFEAVKQAENSAVAIRNGSKESLEQLMYALLLSGMAMQMLGNSRPASGAEHHLSHLWEMNVINPHIDALHGEKVSVGLILCLEKYKSLQSILKANAFTLPDTYEFEYDLLKKYFSPSGLYTMIISENGENILSPVVISRFRQFRGEIVKILEELPDCESVKKKLEDVKCPVSLEQIGLSENIRILSLELSPYIKRRLTMMRLSKLLIES
ncbi:MAG: sn-glycerol-1-phosphate dehydrogenase [Lacrimispora sp.]|uniref:sn-glycerol-1-phosphate dehydrogenase n=1 Tax=Lacrimispora sp. TaxID=2719234 RepID=UPI0039E6AFA5